MVLTISAEISVNMLVSPRKKTVWLTRGHANRDPVIRPRALMTCPEFSIWYTKIPASGQHSAPSMRPDDLHHATAVNVGPGWPIVRHSAPVAIPQMSQMGMARGHATKSINA
jgi:hypothetical protein